MTRQWDGVTVYTLEVECIIVMSLHLLSEEDLYGLGDDKPRMVFRWSSWSYSHPWAVSSRGANPRYTYMYIHSEGPRKSVSCPYPFRHGYEADVPAIAWLVRGEP